MNKTVVMLEIEHKGTLPNELTDEAAGRIYGYLHARGVAVDVTDKLLTEVPAEPKPWEKV